MSEHKAANDEIRQALDSYGRGRLGQYPVIGIGGYAESGKDALADILEEFGGLYGIMVGYLKHYMSQFLEKALLTLNPYVRVTVGECAAVLDVRTERDHYMRYAVLHKRVGYEKSKKVQDVRELLQRLGTEVGRDMIDPNVWTNLLDREIRSKLSIDYKCSVTGIRYANEARMVKRHGGLLVWMDRGGQPVNNHSSDNTLGSDDFDIVVNNRGTLDDLRKWAEVNFLP